MKVRPPIALGRRVRRRGRRPAGRLLVLLRDWHRRAVVIGAGQATAEQSACQADETPFDAAGVHASALKSLRHDMPDVHARSFTL